MSYSHERVRELLIDDAKVVHIKSRSEYEQFCDIVDESGRVLVLKCLHIYDRHTDLNTWNHFAFLYSNVCGIRNHKTADVISFKEFLVQIYADFNDDADLEIDPEIF